VAEQTELAGLDITEYVRRRYLGYQVAPAPHSPHRVNAAFVSELNTSTQSLEISTRVDHAEDVLGEL